MALLKELFDEPIDIAGEGGAERHGDSLLSGLIGGRTFKRLDAPPRPGLTFDEQSHRWVRDGGQDAANDIGQAGAGDEIRPDGSGQNVPGPAGSGLPAGPSVGGGENTPDAAGDGGAGKAVPPGKALFSNPEYWDAKREAAGKAVDAWLDESSAALTPEKAAFYRNAMHAVLDRLPALCLQRILKNTEKMHFFSSVADVTAEFERLDGGRKQEAAVGGFWGAKKGDAQGVLHLDGGHDTGEEYGGEGGTAGTYAHELFHAVDGPDLSISNTRGWGQAWREEIWRERGRDVPLTRYAMSDVVEGFAEYGRLIVTDPQAAKDQFPRCWAYLAKKGMV